MPISISEHFELDIKKFKKTGAFDTLVDFDTHLFVDPTLLREADTPEFKDGEDLIHEHYRNLLKVIAKSKSTGDLFWREAVRQLTFKEIGAFGLGYSDGSTGGHGLGEKMAGRLVENLKQIYDAGVEDPDIFGLVGLFQEGIGPDLIGDMTCSILVKCFAKYSVRVFMESGFQGELSSWEIGGEKFKLPPHPKRANEPVLLAPSELLKDLPLILEGIDIGEIYEENEKLREKLNRSLGEMWKKSLKEFGKEKLKDFFIENPDCLEEVLSVFKKKKPERYDFDADPANQVVWRKQAEEIAQNYPLLLSLSAKPSLSEFYEVIEKIVEEFKNAIEKHGHWKDLYEQGGRVRPESTSQRLFYSVARAYCNANDLDVSPESNAGRGPVDFKISKGAKLKVVVELKLSTNSKVRSGYVAQVTTYKEAEFACKAIYIVVQVRDDNDVFENLLKYKNELGKTKKDLPELVYVNGLKKESASKLKAEKQLPQASRKKSKSAPLKINNTSNKKVFTKKK